MIFFKKAILFLIIFLLVFNVSGFLKPGLFKFSPQRAEAVWWSTLFQQLADYALEIWEWLKVNWQKEMRDLIAKQLVDYIVDETIKWIQGGGDPKFVSDWGSFLDDAGDIVEDAFIKELKLSALCTPFKSQVKAALLPVNKFSKRIQCTLDDIVENIDNFYVDFSQGGWEGYMAMWEPQNNVFGAVLMAQDELTNRKYAAQTAAAKEAVSGGGFLSFKKCVGGKTQSDMCVDWASSSSDYDDCMSLDFSEEELCVFSGGKMQVQTPGNIVGSAAAKSITSDIDWAINIESWISSLINAAINRLISEGLNSMKQSDDEDNEYKDEEYYPEEYADEREEEENSNNQTMIDEINKIKDDWNTILSYKKESLNYASSTLEIYTDTGGSCGSDTGSTVDRLTGEVEDLENKIAEADAAIDTIQNIGGTDGESAYYSFENKYGDEETYGTEVIDAAYEELYGDGSSEGIKDQYDDALECQDQYGGQDESSNSTSTSAD